MVSASVKVDLQNDNTTSDFLLCSQNDELRRCNSLVNSRCAHRMESALHVLEPHFDFLEPQEHRRSALEQLKVVQPLIQELNHAAFAEVLSPAYLQAAFPAIVASATVSVDVSCLLGRNMSSPE